MKLTKLLGAVAAAVLVLMASASTAPATTLSTKGVVTPSSEILSASLKSGGSGLLSDTFGFFANTCTVSQMGGWTSLVTGLKVEGPLSELSFSSCKEELVVVDSRGTFTIEHISGTTNGTVRSSGIKITSPSPFGALTCVTATLSPGTDIGTLTGVKEGQATLDINAVLNCGSTTVKWTGTYAVTSPGNLGVEA